MKPQFANPRYSAKNIFDTITHLASCLQWECLGENQHLSVFTACRGSRYKELAQATGVLH